MKGKLATVLTAISLVAFMLSVSIGTALAQEQVKININTATVEELSTLKRIGASYAQRIVDYRNENGPFQRPEDIMKVTGIGIKAFEANKDIITCE